MASPKLAIAGQRRASAAEDVEGDASGVTYNLYSQQELDIRRCTSNRFATSGLVPQDEELDVSSPR